MAVEEALRLGTISFDAVKHRLLCRIEHRPPRLDQENYPQLPLARVGTTQAVESMTLWTEVGAMRVAQDLPTADMISPAENTAVVG